MTVIDGVLDALREELRRIDSALSILSANGRRRGVGKGSRKPQAKKKKSAATRRRLSLAAKARWAAAKKAGKNKL
jgi:hypothetical protein